MAQPIQNIIALQGKSLLIPIITLLALVSISLLPAIPQDIHYHQFVDQRSFMGIANFLNVISNLPYLIFGLMGLLLLTKPSSLPSSIKYVYRTLFIGVILVCLGSAYYHLSPSNMTLLWDRLPMSIVFMSYFTVVIAEYIEENKARIWFIPLLLLGVASVLYWHWTESMQQGDLRFYVLVQFLPLVLIPIILWRYPPRYSHSGYFWLMIACYLAAKGFEVLDEAVFDSLGMISGHSLKHLVSSLAAFWFYLALKKRTQRFDYQ